MNARQQGAYPSLIPGNKDGARDPSKPWDVIELEGEDSLRAGRIGPSTSKDGRILKLPKPVLQHDWLVRQHELTHVGRPHMARGKNQLRNRMRQMIEEVAVDGQSLNRDLLDLRSARDKFDYASYPKPTDVYDAAAMYFQVWTSAQVSQYQPLLDYYHAVLLVLTAEEAREPKLAGLIETLAQAAQACFDDYSTGNCEDWADIVTAKLLGVPKEELPNAPEPPKLSQPGGSETESDPGGTEPVEGVGDDASDGGSEPGDDDDSDPDDQACPACAGEGVDEDGDECPGCGGTGENADSGRGPAGGQSQPGSDGEGETDSGAEGEGQDHPGIESHSEWDDAPIPLDKSRVNDPMEFGFDPLGKTEVDPNQEPEGPSLAHDRQRDLITQEQLQEAIDQERVNRKSGESGQSEEITIRTPHGAVDVHRHTLTKGVATTVALSWRSSEMGATVRYPGNLFQGGRVFAKRAPGGAIILDCSGSMSWHAQHIIAAQKVMPNLYVAGYDYHGSNGYWKASHGIVAPDTYIARYCVLAAKGQLDPDGVEHMGQEWQHTGGNSGADPAALWYAVRAVAGQPIVWVSDGMVSFGESQGFYKQCDALMRRHKIVRVMTIEDAIDYLLGKSVPGWHQSATVDTHWVRLGQPYMGRSIDPEKTYSEAARWTQTRANSRKR